MTNGRPFDVAVLEVRPSPDFRIVQILEERQQPTIFDPTCPCDLTLC